MRPPPIHTPAPQPVKNRKGRTAHTPNTHTIHRDARTPSPHNTHPRPPTPPPPAAPPPTPHTSEHHPPAATHYIRTTAPPGRSCGRLPPTPRHHNQSRTARAARRTRATPTRPTGTLRPPASTTPTPAPPITNSANPTPPPPAPPPRDQATDATRGSQHQPIDVDTPADTCHRESPLQRPPQETPAPDPTRDNDDQPPQPTPPPRSHAAPPAAAPAEPYALHNPAAVRQHLRGLGEHDVVLCLRTSGTSTRIWAATLVQAATLGEGVRDFLFDTFLHVARHDRPPRATPDSKSPPPTGSRIWVPPIDCG